MAKKINVWIIDDDKINNLICRTMLREKDWLGKCDEFTDSPSALQQIKTLGEENLPDIILLDINMPNQSGWDFLNEVQEQSSVFERNEIPCVVLLTSSIDEEDEERASEHPLVQGLISKPLNVDRLMKLCGTSAKIFS